MSKNLIPEIAKLLGVEIEEEFKVDFLKDTYRFSDTRLECFYILDQSWRIATEQVLRKILCGEYEIVKLPWKPKVGERYFTYFGAGFTVVDCAWQGFATQYSLLKNGCVFRTEEEAIKKRPEIHKELTGREWSNET